MCEVTDRASDAWSQFDGASDAKLWQIQVDHAARPSALFDLRGRALSAFSPLFARSVARVRLDEFMDVFDRALSCCMCSGRKFGDFLEEASRSSDGFPKSLEELSKAAGIKLVLADSNDPDSVGFIQWRAAFYVAGEDHACPWLVGGPYCAVVALSYGNV